MYFQDGFVTFLWNVIIALNQSVIKCWDRSKLYYPYHKKDPYGLKSRQLMFLCIIHRNVAGISGVIQLRDPVQGVCLTLLPPHKIVYKKRKPINDFPVWIKRSRSNKTLAHDLFYSQNYDGHYISFTENLPIIFSFTNCFFCL